MKNCNAIMNYREGLFEELEEQGFNEVNRETLESEIYVGRYCPYHKIYCGEIEVVEVRFFEKGDFDKVAVLYNDTGIFEIPARNVNEKILRAEDYKEYLLELLSERDSKLDIDDAISFHDELTEVSRVDFDVDKESYNAKIWEKVSFDSVEPEPLKEDKFKELYLSELLK